MLGNPADVRAVPRPLADDFGRIATDLRVSLTDRCNLRCSYCMPEQGLDWLPRSDVLTAEEVIRLITVAVERLGVRQVRFTGGEPLLRRDLEHVVAAVSALNPRPELSLTTNGIGLDRRAVGLAAAGLDRINVSLDTLDPERFARLTRRDRLGDVLAGLRAAADAGLGPVKVNAVLLRGINDDEAEALLRFCLTNEYHLRFIEQMPLDAGHIWDRTRMIRAEEILAGLGRSFALTENPVARGSAPAETWLVDGGPGTVGIIGSVTRAFCGTCDRTRLTADGQMRTCLFAAGETDLRVLLRDGADDDVIAAAWQRAMGVKKAGHDIDDLGFLPPARPMSAIGG